MGVKYDENNEPTHHVPTAAAALNSGCPVGGGSGAPSCRRAGKSFSNM